MNYRPFNRSVFELARSIAAAITFAVVAGRASANQTSEPSLDFEKEAVKTEMKDGYCIGLLGSKEYSVKNVTPDENLVIFTWTTNEDGLVAVPAELEYAYQVEMFDTNGAAVPKTWLGKRIGRKFSEFGPNPAKQGIIVKHVPARHFGEVISGPILFYPNKIRDFFQVGKPGEYTLQIHFQILACPKTALGRGQYKSDLIRFQPLTFPIVQLPERTNSLPQ